MVVDSCRLLIICNSTRSPQRHSGQLQRLPGKYCRLSGSFARKSLTAGGGCLAFPVKVALKEFPCPALTLFAEDDRLRLRLGIGDVPPGIEAFHRSEIVSASPVANDPKTIISVFEFRRDAGTCRAS